jgi:hypothetical protein
VEEHRQDGITGVLLGDVTDQEIWLALGGDGGDAIDGPFARDAYADSSNLRPDQPFMENRPAVDPESRHGRPEDLAAPAVNEVVSPGGQIGTPGEEDEQEAQRGARCSVREGSCT